MRRTLPTTAVVHTGDRICFVTTASSPDALFSKLAAYVRMRCDDVLWADVAAEVHALLDAGNAQAAVKRYFERTGERWDEERCELVTMPAGDAWIADEEQIVDA
ncbi:MAG: hypothetical protein ABJB66_07150 [Gemmatimonadaceae bacterium]